MCRPLMGGKKKPLSPRERIFFMNAVIWHCEEAAKDLFSFSSLGFSSFFFFFFADNDFESSFTQRVVLN